MSGARADARLPLGNMRFRVEIDGVSEGGAVEVILPEARIAGPAPKAGAARSVQHGSLILRRGLTRSADWYAWWDQARRSATRARRSVRVTLRDATGEGATSWIFRNVEPLAYQLSPLHALGNEAVLETPELAVGGFGADRNRQAGIRRTAPLDGSARSHPPCALQFEPITQNETERLPPAAPPPFAAANGVARISCGPPESGTGM